MTIVWDQLIVENILLAGIIVGSIYLEQWGHRRSQITEEKESRRRIIMYLTDDLQKRLDFIDETHLYSDFKPFFTDMWDAIILAGKHALLPFELFQSLQRTYSWMKYYNSELDSSSDKVLDEKVLRELLDDVRKSINRSLKKLNETKEFKNSMQDHQIAKPTIDITSNNIANRIIKSS
jgi:GTP1/Obg family GTP-binding protein